MKTAAIISYASYHNNFIERCILEARKVCDVVIVVGCHRFFNGKYDKDIRKDLVDYWLLYEDNGKPSRFWHNLARYEGFLNFKADYDAVFFIDSDEILEGDRVKEWLKNEAEIGLDYKLAHFWYYRDTCFRADQIEEGAVLVSRESLKSPEMEWFGDRERENFSKDWNYMTGYQGYVLGHHYSWAGTKEMLLKKVSTWGHNNDNIDWKSMVEEEYSHEFNYTCPFKNYTFTKIKPYVDFEFKE